MQLTCSAANGTQCILSKGSLKPLFCKMWAVPMFEGPHQHSQASGNIAQQRAHRFLQKGAYAHLQHGLQDARVGLHHRAQCLELRVVAQELQASRATAACPSASLQGHTRSQRGLT